MSDSPGPRILLTGADPLQGLVAARSLGRAGYRVELSAACRTRNARSRYVVASGRHPDALTAPDAFVAWVNERVTASRIDAVLPVDDATTYTLASAAQRGDLGATLAAPSKRLLDDSLDKRVLARNLDLAGLRTPAAAAVDDAPAAERFARSHGPVVVKSVAALLADGDGSVVQGGRVARCTDPMAAATAAAGIIAIEGRVLVQELIVGPEVGIGGVRGSAGELPLFAQRKVRGWPPRGGPPAVARSVEPPGDVVAAVTRLLDQLDWVGAAQLDVILGPDGPVIIDLNARPWYSVGLAVAAGVDIPVFAVRAARGEPIPTRVDYPAGLGWVSVEPEVRYLVCLVGGWRGVRQPGEGLVRGLRRWRREVARPRRVDPLDRDDPAPAFGRLGIELAATLVRNRRERHRASVALQVAVVDSIGARASAWDRLAGLAPRTSPFLRSWWIDATIAGRPRVLLVQDGGELIGGLALEVLEGRGVPWLRVAGATLSPDHVDLVAAPGRSDDVLGALGAWLRASDARVIDLEGVAWASRLGEILPRPVHRVQCAVAPWTALPADFQTYWAARPPTLRRTVERSARRLEREGAVYDVVPVTEVDRALAEFWGLHALRWGGESSLRALEDRFDRAVRAGVAQGEAVVHRLRVEGRSIAMEIWFEVDGVASFYQSARDPDRRWRSAGSVLKARVIERACQRGDREVDFLRGDEPYKLDWVDETRPLLRLRAVHGVSGYAAVARHLAVRRVLRRGAS